MTDGKDERNSVIVSMEIDQDPGAVHNRAYNANSDTKEKNKDSSLASKTGKSMLLMLFLAFIKLSCSFLHSSCCSCSVFVCSTLGVEKVMAVYILRFPL